MYKGEKWYKLFLIAKAMDERVVAPPEPDPSHCSITKRAWNKALFKWKHDTKALVDDLYAPNGTFYRKVTRRRYKKLMAGIGATIPQSREPPVADAATL